MKKQTMLLAAGLLAAAPLWAADGNAALAAKAEAAFGKNDAQSFDAQAVKHARGVPRTETMTVTLAPGKGIELKADLDAGQGLVFHWTASADVAVDFHGDPPGSTKEYTSFDVEAAQRQASGLFVAPFSGHHGWYWKNRSQQPVKVTITVTGFQKRLFRPEH
jgi:hypothetical protein